MALPRGNSKTGPGKTLRLHFPLTHHRGLRRGHTAKVEVPVKEGSLGASDILPDRPRRTLTSTLVIGVLSSTCAATAASQSAASLLRERPVCFPRPTHPHLQERQLRGSCRVNARQCKAVQRKTEVELRQRGPFAPTTNSRVGKKNSRMMAGRPEAMA